MASYDVDPEDLWPGLELLLVNLCQLAANKLFLKPALTCRWQSVSCNVDSDDLWVQLGVTFGVFQSTCDIHYVLFLFRRYHTTGATSESVNGIIEKRLNEKSDSMSSEVQDERYPKNETRHEIKHQCYI